MYAMIWHKIFPILHKRKNNAIMTLKELLLQCKFEDVANSIKKLYEEQVGMLPHYKEVFDRLRHMEAMPCEGSIHIHMIQSEWMDPYLCVDGLHEVSTEEELGRELQFEVELSLEELAAHCLWEFTFYGFSDEDFADTVNKWEGMGHTHYGKRAYELEKNYYRGLIYINKKEKKSLKRRDEIFRGIAFSMGTWSEIDLHKSHCNRIRRKRNYRINKRITELKRKDKVEWLIQRLTANPSPNAFMRNDLNFLFFTSQIKEVEFHSYAYDANKRVSYLQELIEKHSSYNFYGYSQYLVLVTVSSAYPISSEESLSFIANLFPKEVNVQWGFNYKNNLIQEISILIVMCK